MASTAMSNSRVGPTYPRAQVLGCPRCPSCSQKPPRSHTKPPPPITHPYTTQPAVLRSNHGPSPVPDQTAVNRPAQNRDVPQVPEAYSLPDSNRAIPVRPSRLPVALFHLRTFRTSNAMRFGDRSQTLSHMAHPHPKPRLSRGGPCAQSRRKVSPQNQQVHRKVPQVPTRSRCEPSATKVIEKAPQVPPPWTQTQQFSRILKVPQVPSHRSHSPQLPQVPDLTIAIAAATAHRKSPPGPIQL